MQVYDIPIDSTRREITRHGSDAFRLAVYQTQLSKNVLGYVNWHWHEELQFCRVVRGRICVRTRQAQYTLHTGQGLFLHANALHSIVPVEGTDGTYVCIDVHPAFLGGTPGSAIVRNYIGPYLQEEGLRNRVLSPDVPQERTVLSHMDAIYRLYRDRPFGYELDIWIDLLHIWRQLVAWECAGTTTDAIKEGGEERLRTLLMLMQQRYAEKLTLRDFADAVHLCNSECCRFFKQAMGRTIFAHLLQVRLEKSVSMLMDTDAPISRIAYDCGFGSTSYYIERFGKQFGQTPLTFRRAAHGKKSGGAELMTVVQVDTDVPDAEKGVKEQHREHMTVNAQ